MKIKELPKEIQERIFECQIEQGNKPTNELTLGSNRDGYNFDWSYSTEGLDFWNKINSGNYEIFFARYPKKEAFKERVMVVSNDNINWFQTVVFDNRKERYFAWFGSKTLEDSVPITRVMTWRYAKDIEETEDFKITFGEVAKLVGCNVNKLKIIF